MISKRAFELAVNQLVIIILMIVIVGVGFTMFFNLREGIKEINVEVSAEQERMIERTMINSGGRVVIPFTTVDAERGDAVYVLIGIENIEASEHTFEVVVNAYSGTTQSGEQAPIPIDTGLQDITIGAKKREYRKIYFRVPNEAQVGKQYDYTVSVCYKGQGDGTQPNPSQCPNQYNVYPPKEKVYVKVK